MPYKQLGTLKGSTPSDAQLRALILAVLKTLKWSDLSG